jgi:endonuclease/exonuclease/phosphatase family metal-dependent hydrolase
MLKLVSLNMEGPKHYSTVFPFVDRENPDVLCLQEAPQETRNFLQERGYKTTFAPMCSRTFEDTKHVIGILLATKLPQKTHLFYYWENPGGATALYNPKQPALSVSNAYLMATIQNNGSEYNIATTHVMDTKNGASDSHQEKGVSLLINSLKKDPSHIICGDFNMPRHHNHLYEKFTNLYKDEIPRHYQSSLDKNLHRLGNVKIDQPIFDKFMVDYIFSQPEYEVTAVHLEFGVSDHAAIVANITRV